MFIGFTPGAEACRDWSAGGPLTQEVGPDVGARPGCPLPRLGSPPGLGQLGQVFAGGSGGRCLPAGSWNQTPVFVHPAPDAFLVQSSCSVHGRQRHPGTAEPWCAVACGPRKPLSKGCASDLFCPTPFKAAPEPAPACPARDPLALHGLRSSPCFHLLFLESRERGKAVYFEICD